MEARLKRVVHLYFRNVYRGTYERLAELCTGSVGSSNRDGAPARGRPLRQRGAPCWSFRARAVLDSDSTAAACVGGAACGTRIDGDAGGPCIEVGHGRAVCHFGDDVLPSPINQWDNCWVEAHRLGLCPAPPPEFPPAKFIEREGTVARRQSGGSTCLEVRRGATLCAGAH